MRNKIGFLVALFVVSAACTFAQVQLALGIKGGPNFAKLDVNSSPGENYKNRTGFHGGAFMLVKVSKIGIQPEVLFSKQGSNFTIPQNGDYQSTFDYINIPVILKLYTVAGINLQLGPQIGFLAKAGGDAVSSSSTTGVVPASKSLYKNSDLSAAFGVGWDLPFGLTVDGRYNLGLSKIQDSPDLNSTKNQVIQISLGYKLIKVGKK